MARIQPAAAWRFNPERVANLGDALAPPYDRIDRDTRARLEESGPINVVRLMPGGATLSEDNLDRLNAAAAATAAAWRADGTLLHDAEPGLYYYRQAYAGADGRLRVRKGFFALLELEDEDTGVVLPHEADWTNPRVERLDWLEATHLLATPILLLFSDAEREVMSALTGAADEVEPVIDTDAADGAHHQVFRLTDAELIARVRELMAPRTVILADGHHRYRTQQAYAAAHPDDAEAQRILACFVPIQDEGLSLAPIHRAVSGVPDFQHNDLLFELSKTFYIRELSAEDTAGDVLKFALEEMARDDEFDLVSFVAVLAGGPEILLLSVKNDAAKLVLPEGLAEPIRDMDVSLLHRLVLEGPLGLDPDDRARGEVTFFEDPHDLPRLIADGATQAVFLVNPAAASQLEAVVKARLKLPHKVARFCPDVPAGLIMQSFADFVFPGGNDD